MKDELSKEYEEVLDLLNIFSKDIEKYELLKENIDLEFKKLKKNENDKVAKNRLSKLLKEFQELTLKLGESERNFNLKLESNPELSGLMPLHGYDSQENQCVFGDEPDLPVPIEENKMDDRLSKDYDEVLAIVDKIKKTTKQRDKTIDKIEIGLKKLQRNENNMVVKKETDNLFKELDKLNIKIEKLNNELEEKLDSNPELQELKMRCRPYDKECENRKLTSEEEERKAVTELACDLIQAQTDLNRMLDDSENFIASIKDSDDMQDRIMENVNKITELSTKIDNLKKIIIDRTKDNPHFKDLYNHLIKGSRVEQRGIDPDDGRPKL